jgi:hypothetical protein
MNGDTSTITKVQEFDDSYELCYGGHICWFCSKEYFKGTNIVPKVGDEITIYTINFSTVRGMDLNGENIFYKSDLDLQRERQEALARMRKEKEEQLPKNLEQFEKLQGLWKTRVASFRRRGGHEWDLNYLGYETMVCRDASILASRVKKDKLQWFSKLTAKKQHDLIPEVDWSMHSGNSFGMVIRLAQVWFEDPRYVVVSHGAMHGLTGCQEYKCFAGVDTTEQMTILKEAGIDPNEFYEHTKKNEE